MDVARERYLAVGTVVNSDVDRVINGVVERRGAAASGPPASDEGMSRGSRQAWTHEIGGQLIALTPEQATALRLIYLQGLRYRDAAAVMRVSTTELGRVLATGLCSLGQLLLNQR